MNRIAPAAALALALLLAGCGGGPATEEDTPAAGSNRPSEAPAEPAEPAEPEPEPEPEPTEDSGPLTFGETISYPDGLEVTVGQPAPFTPSATSAGGEGFPATVAFDVVVVNGTEGNFDPVLFNTTLQSANAEGSAVFDSEQGLNGPPATPLLPGREAKFRIGYAVQDPGDLVLQVTPSFEHEAAIFASS